MPSDIVIGGILLFLGTVVTALAARFKAQEEARGKELERIDRKSQQQDERLDSVTKALQDEREANIICEREKNKLINEALVDGIRKDARIKDLEKALGNRDLPEERVGWTS